MPNQLTHLFIVLNVFKAIKFDELKHQIYFLMVHERLDVPNLFISWGMASIHHPQWNATPTYVAATTSPFKKTLCTLPFCQPLLHLHTPTIPNQLK